MGSAGKPAFLGDVKPKEAFDLLSKNQNSALVDVRTRAELAFVGAPDLTGLGKSIHHIEWSRFPGGEINSNFLHELAQVVESTGCEHLLFLCRSGGRSLHAAKAAEAMSVNGSLSLYNVASGFEGDLDSEGRRGRVSGWKVDGLPWRQS